MITRCFAWMTVAVLASAPAFGDLIVGPDWKEGNGGSGDAGPLPGSAQIPVTALPFPALLRTIAGSLDETFLVGPPDQQDLYAIYILDPISFVATTDSTVDIFGTASFNSQLFLFDSTGLPVVANDGVSDGATVMLPTLSLVPGIYYLGISLFNSDPFDASATALFPDLTGPQLLPSNLAAPASWGSSPFSGGNYVLALTGAVFVPAPAAVAMLLLLPMHARRRAGAPVRSPSIERMDDRPRVRRA